jgi:predicted neuraminidase
MKLRELRGRIEEKAHEPNAAAELGPLREELAQLDDELKKLQGEAPLYGRLPRRPGG